jgi:hypothetical protein
MSPAATPPTGPDKDLSNGPAAFGALIHDALQARGRAAADPSQLIASGELMPQALCRFAAGRLNGSERDELQGYLARTPWALGRVSALVRGARADGANPIAIRIVSAAKEEGTVDPYRTVADALLDDLGHQGALDDDLERLSDAAPLAKAAWMLGRNQRQEAADAFASLDPSSPLAQAAKRLAALDDQDEALAHLLDHI